jgi:CelD/BcsL family acetyltransferase involved in cellulose biosynthesis
MIRTLDPLSDPRWRELVQRDERATAFHTPEWLDALRRTYGFVPVVYTTDGPGDDLRSAIPFCAVASWLTGRRLVSLPFSDHCEPLVADPASLGEILDHLASEAHRSGWRYIQLRPRGGAAVSSAPGFQHGESNYHHTLDLRPDLDTLFKGIKKDNQTAIRKAERSALRYAVGRDAAFVRAYFALHVMTRSTQGVPPQPSAWFHNLAHCLGDMLDIHLLLEDDTPIAGMVTILFQGQLMCKYTASDRLRDPTGLGKSLLWRSIGRAKELGATNLDWGRCEPEDVGLAQYKERWGARRSELSYLRFPAPSADRPPADRPRSRWAAGAAKSIIPRLPASVLTMAGRLAYRHVG